MPDELLCRDVYDRGCARPLTAPSWFHDDEWIDHDGRDPGPWLRRDVPDVVVRMLAASPHVPTRVAVLTGNPPPDVVDELALDAHRGVRVGALRRTHQPDLLRAAAAGDHRAAVAANRSAPVPLLLELAEQPDFETWYALVHNPAVPDDVRTRLVDDGVDAAHPYTRGWALRMTTSVPAMRRAARSEDLEARRAVAANPDLPGDLMQLLAAVSDPGIALALRHRRPR